MNQILDTGDEQFKNSNSNYGNYNKKQKTKVNKEKNIIEINKVIIFFSISIILFGICIIVGSIYSKNKINQVVEESARPTIDFNFDEDNSSVDILVKHVKGIKQISYILNDENEKVMDGKNQTIINTTIKLVGGQNKLVVKAIDENNNEVKYERNYVVGKLADISLENIDNGVKVSIESEETIKTISYRWDEEEEKTINVNSKQYTGDISAPKGKHTLKIVVLDEKDVKTEKTQVVIAATAPEISVSGKIKDGEYYYVINITDETELKNVKITLDGEEKVNTEVNEKTYSTEIQLQNNSENKLVIEASNGKLTSNSRKSRPLPIN